MKNPRLRTVIRSLRKELERTGGDSVTVFVDRGEFQVDIIVKNDEPPKRIGFQTTGGE